MIRQAFLGRLPSHFKVNPTVRSFIFSESLVWSAWNLIAPIFAIYAANEIPGGNISTAASAVSIYLIIRILLELVSSQYFKNSSVQRQLMVILVGIILVALSFVGLSFTKSVTMLYIFYSLSGVGFGISTPVKNSLFSTHLDKNKEPTEWGIYDATVFVGMALSAALGGFIAQDFGFKALFWLAAVLTIFGSVPYMMFLRSKGKEIDFTVIIKS